MQNWWKNNYQKIWNSSVISDYTFLYMTGQINWNFLQVFHLFPTIVWNFFLIFSSLPKKPSTQWSKQIEYVVSVSQLIELQVTFTHVRYSSELKGNNGELYCRDSCVNWMVLCCWINSIEALCCDSMYLN